MDDELTLKIREAMLLARDEPHTKQALQNALTFHEAAMNERAASNPTQEG